MAEPIVKQMIELDPTDPTNYFQLAGIYENSGDYEIAEQTFLKAKEAKPNDPNVYMQLAGYYNRQGDFPKTIEALNQRVAHRAEQPRGPLHRVHLLLGQGVPRLPAEGRREARDGA